MYVFEYMAQHYKFYPASEETVVPFNATYSFPSQVFCD